MIYYSKKTKLKKQKKTSHTRIAVGAALALAVAVGVLAVLDVKNVIDIPFFKDKPVAQTGTKDTINYGPPTTNEKAAGNARKDDLKDDSSSTPAPTLPSGKKGPIPVITSYGQDPSSKEALVGGFVPGTVESGGSCTLTLEKDGKKVTATNPATPNASTVSCGVIAIARDKLSAGTWSATLSYASYAYEATSQPQQLAVE